jgi:hypothetical protein
VPRELVAPVLSGTRIPTATLGTEVKQFQLLDEDGRLLAVAHAEDGRTVYDRVFPELVRAAPEAGARAAGPRGSGLPGA